MAHDATYTIDAAGKSIGRIAAEAAKALMGKMRADYTPNKDAKIRVSVHNAGKIVLTEKKRVQKAYTSYSGYPGGLKRESLASLRGRKGNGEAIRRAVMRMLPRNTMRASRMKHLVVTE